MMMQQASINPYGEFPNMPTPERDLDIPRKFRQPTTDVMRPLMAPPSLTKTTIRYNIPTHGAINNPQIMSSDPCISWFTCSCLPDFDDYCRCCRSQVIEVMDGDMPVRDVPAVDKVNTTYWAIESMRGLCHCWRPCNTDMVRTRYADVKVVLRQHNYYDRCTCPNCRRYYQNMLFTGI